MAILDAVVERVTLGEHDGRSGGLLERVRLADGTRLIVKRVSPRTDLLMRATDDGVGREYALWRDGVLERLPPGVGNPVVEAWREGDDTVLVMRDLGESVLTWDDAVRRADSRRVLTALHAVHERFVTERHPALCDLTRRFPLFSPNRMRLVADTGSPLVAASLRGWEVFVDTVPTDVAGPVLDLLEDAGPLVDALTKRPCTLIHGDLFPVNVALTTDEVVLLDWGWASWAPPALDIEWWLLGSAVIDATRDEILADYREIAGPAYDDVAVRLMMVAGLLDLGWNKALDSVDADDPAVRERERADLDWWVDQARQTLDDGLLSDAGRSRGRSGG